MSKFSYYGLLIIALRASVNMIKKKKKKKKNNIYKPYTYIQKTQYCACKPMNH